MSDEPGNEVGEPVVVAMPTGYPTVVDALRVTLAELDLDDVDQAASALAWRLAEFIDGERKSGHALAEMSGKLLAVLESLGATPAARKALLKGVTSDVRNDSGNDALDELRTRRDRRAYGAAAVDPAAP